MYRIFVESYNNFINSIDKNSYRIKNAKPLELLANINKYNDEKNKQSELYKKVSDLIFYLNDNLNKFPRMKAFLWTLESRNIKGTKYNVTTNEELEEQTKLINSFLKLSYWY
jgi:hypothetical protein